MAESCNMYRLVPFRWRARGAKSTKATLRRERMPLSREENSQHSQTFLPPVQRINQDKRHTPYPLKGFSTLALLSDTQATHKRKNGAGLHIELQGDLKGERFRPDDNMRVGGRIVCDVLGFRENILVARNLDLHKHSALREGHIIESRYCQPHQKSQFLLLLAASQQPVKHERHAAAATHTTGSPLIQCATTTQQRCVVTAQPLTFTGQGTGNLRKAFKTKRPSFRHSLNGCTGRGYS